MSSDTTLGWRYFRRREIREARLWAAMGGIAVHDNEGAFPFVRETGDFKIGSRPRTYRETAHLLARDAAALIAAASEIGISHDRAQAWLQHRSALHLDIFGSPLRRAVELCEQASAEVAR